MWERREARKAREADQSVESEEHTNPRKEGGLHAKDRLLNESLCSSDDELKKMLLHRPGRGRGGIGSRAIATAEGSSDDDLHREEEFTTVAMAMAVHKRSGREDSKAHKKKRHTEEKKEMKRKRDKRDKRSPSRESRRRDKSKKY
jgi:hypothetical protein